MELTEMLTEAYRRSLNSLSINILAQEYRRQKNKDDGVRDGCVFIAQRINGMILPSLWTINFGADDKGVTVAAHHGKMCHALMAHLSMGSWMAIKKVELCEDNLVHLYEHGSTLKTDNVEVAMHDPEMFEKIDKFLSTILHEWLAHYRLDTRAAAVQLEI